MLEELLEKYDDLVIMDGFDSCIVGVGESCGQPPRVIYSVKKIIGKLTIEEGMSHEEAFEWFEFNQFGAYVGEQTPIFLFEPTED